MALSFAFGGSSGQSYEELRRKRAFAEEMQKRGAQGGSTTAIQGINSAAKSILGALLNKKFGQEEDAARAASQEHRTNVLGSLLGGGGGTGGYSPVAAPVDPNSPATIGADAMAALGKPTNQPEGLGAFNAALSARESGGNYGVVNSEGYGGKYQFGDERLKDYSNATGENITMQQFLANPALQERVQAWHVGDIDKRLGSYVGTEVNGKPMTRDGIRAMAHLGGVGGARQFIESGGKYNPADSNGTTLANYAGIQGNGLASPEIAIPQLIGLLNDPYASEADKSVLGMLLQQQFAQMQPPDPMDALALEKAQLEIDAMRNPQPEPGYRTLSVDEVSQLGLPPGPYQVGPKGEIKPIGGGGTNVTVNNVPGTPPSDGALRKKLMEAEGTSWGEYLKAGSTASGMTQDMELLGQVIEMAPQGPISGRLAAAFPGVSDAAGVFQSVVKRIAPSLRVEGSGAQSDIEYNGFLQSLPALENRPEANRSIATFLKAKAAINMERGQAIQMYQNGEIDASEARKRIKEIDSRSILSPELKGLLGAMDGGGDLSTDDAEYLRSLGLEP